MSIHENFKLQNIFLKDGNRPYCEDWSYIDTVARDDEPHATENPPTSPLGIIFLGAIKFCLQTLLPYQKLVPPKTRHPSSTPKGESEPKVWVLYNNNR